jgi:hypothetical protein
MDSDTLEEIKKLNGFQVGMESYKEETKNGTSYFIYRPEQTVKPLMQNITLGYKLDDQFNYRLGKRYIKIKRFGKTKRYYTTKWQRTTGRILNDHWIRNLRAE